MILAMVSANQMKHFVTNWEKERHKGPLRLIVVRGSLFAVILYVILSLVKLKTLGFQESFLGKEGLGNMMIGAVIGYLNAGYHYWSQERTWRRYQETLPTKKAENNS